MLTCPVCASEQLLPLVNRDDVPCHQNLLRRTPEAARTVKTGTLDIRLCERCGFAYNAAFDSALLDYGDAYENAQEHSPAFQAHLLARLRELTEARGFQNQRIIEVGCGQGGLLKRLVEDPKQGNVGYGFDPSYHGPEQLYDGRLRFFKRYYDETCASIPADIVLCRHVIEHVPDPLALLSTIRRALASSPQARLFFETPDLEWILKHHVFWDFFYEHCSYFTGPTLKTCFERAGFEVLNVSRVFENQYLWLEAKPSQHFQSITDEPEPARTLALQYRQAEQAILAYWMERLEALTRKGPVALWGAGAKGATFARLMDPHCERIACVIDINAKKQGAYIPGTAHPIVSSAQAREWKLESVILMNPNYRAESQTRMKDIFPNLHWEVAGENHAALPEPCRT